MLPDHVCSEEYPLDCSYCDDPYPVSTVINGICACVQCTWDKDCPGDCYCDQEALACACGGPPPGCNQCGESSDCSHPDYGGLLCDLTTRCCYHEEGWCDGDMLKCNIEQDSSCMLDGPFSFPPGPTYDHPGGACTCTDPLDFNEYLACATTGTCPVSPECFGYAACVDVSAQAELPGPQPFCVTLGMILTGTSP